MLHLAGRERPDWLGSHLIRGRFGHYKYMLAACALDHAGNRLVPAAMGVWNRDLIPG